MYNCKRCNKLCTEKYGSGNFCSRQCANSRVRTDEIKKKISSGVKTSEAYLNDKMNPNKKKPNIEKTCQICSNIFSVRPSNKKKFCSINCSVKSPRMGGYRDHSGHSKTGWFKGFYCGSSWELAFLIWCLDNHIPVQRCTKKFPYTFKGSTRNYFPDFIVNDIYVEIKGYITEQTISKIEQFPEKLLVLCEDDLQFIFDYVKEKYGNDYIKLYENNPYEEKINSCKECGNLCKKIYCSQKCSILGNNYYKMVARMGAAPISPD
jgi:hypothetical protein